MNPVLAIIVAIILFWIVLSWASYILGGWHKWVRLFRRRSKAMVSLAKNVSLRRFGGYNRCVRVGTDEYGVVFSPLKILLFHDTFIVPWAQILGYEVSVNRMRSVCILHITQGDIRIYGNMAEF